MSRSSTLKFNEDKVVFNTPMRYNKNPKVLLIDADSLAYTCGYLMDETDLEELKYRIRRKIQEITMNAEEWFNIVDTVLFVGGDNNYRYKIYPEYKANRPEKPEVVKLIKEYLITDCGAIQAEYGEADDSIKAAFDACEGQCVICTSDKDIKAHCHGWFYDYKHSSESIGKFDFVTEPQMMYNKVYQFLIGDASDNIKVNKGFGPKSAEKLLDIGMSKFTYMRKILEVYKKYNGENARKVLKNTYLLLNLFTPTEIKSLSLQHN